MIYRHSGKRTFEEILQNAAKTSDKIEQWDLEKEQYRQKNRNVRNENFQEL
jgi:hypothetical protein